MTVNIRSKAFWLFASIVVWLLLTGSNIALAADATGAQGEFLNPNGAFDSVIVRFNDAVQVWGIKLFPYAERLFWGLAGLSLTWTLCLMALRQAEIGDVFVELVKFIAFTGFFFALLQMATAPIYGLNETTPMLIIKSFTHMVTNGSEATDPLTPSGIIDQGFEIFAMMTNNVRLSAPSTWVAMLCSVAMLILLALIAINILILQVSVYFMAYAGIFLLGFGGSRWTSDMAINYYRKVLEICVQLFAAILLVIVAKDILKEMFNYTTGAVAAKDIMAALLTVLVLYKLVTTLPAMLASIVSGAAIGQVGQFGGGAALAAAGMAGGAIGSTASWGNKQSQNLMGTSAEKLKATASAIASGDPKAKMPSKLKMALSTKSIDDLAVAGSAKALGAAVKGGAHGSVLAAKATAGIAKGGLHAAREVKSFGEVMGTVGGFTREGLGGVTKT